jgi:hypothetical protein
MISSLVRQVRPEERPAVRDAFLLLFGFTCGHLLLETARDALFLARLPAHRLPWVYLAIAVLALVLLKRAPVSDASVEFIRYGMEARYGHAYAGEASC